MTPAPSALGRLIGIPTDEFATTYWGRQPLLTRAADNADAALERLFDHDAADELIAHRGLRAPFLRVAKNGSTFPQSEFTAPGGVGAEVGDQLDDTRLLGQFADGATLVLQALHRTWEPIRAFAADLAGELGHPVQVNAYLTPPQNTGFSDHYDIHDVFVVQVAGTKAWRIRPPVIEAPLRSQPWDARRGQVAEAAQQPPLIAATLAPGDVLYLPRGYIHAATALGEISTHLTLGIHNWTGHHLADQLLAYAGRHAAGSAAIRSSLPLGLDLAGPASRESLAAVETARATLIEALTQAPAEAIVAALADRHRASTRPDPVGPIAVTQAAAALTEDSELGVRAHLAITLTDRDDDLVIDSRSGRHVVGGADRYAVRSLLETGRARAGDLGLDLARRLVTAGIATVAG